MAIRREERIIIERRPGSGRVSINGEELREGQTIEISVMRDNPGVASAAIASAGRTDLGKADR